MGGVEVLVRIMEQVLGENLDFAVFRACEKAVAVLRHIPVSNYDKQILQLLMSSNCMNSMAIVLQRSGTEVCFLESPQEFVNCDCEEVNRRFPN